MKLSRRHFLFATATVAIITSAPEPGLTRGRRVSQEELDEAIRLHSMWLADINTGQRCMFGGRDLSGLQFGVLSGGPVDLNGADLRKPISQERKRMISWFIIAVSTARNWTVAAGDNRSLRSPTCVGYRPKEPNGALQLFVVQRPRHGIFPILTPADPDAYPMATDHAHRAVSCCASYEDASATWKYDISQK